MPPETEPSASEGGRRGRLSARALTLLAAVAIVLYCIDQATKYLIAENLHQGDVVPVLGQFVQLHFVTNSGAAFSLGSGFTWILSIVAVAAIVVIVVLAPRIRSFGWAAMFGLLLGGAVGNATDRLFREPGFGTGHVVDFLQIYGFPAIFNVADIGVTSAMALFVILTLRGVSLGGTRTPLIKTTPTAGAS